MNNQMIFRASLLSAIDELKKKNNISCTNYGIHICPDISEKELSRIASLDLYYRDFFIKGAHKSRIYTLDEFVKRFSPPFGIPLWINMSLISCEDNIMHIKMEMSIRFRKPRELHNQETGHPPIRVL